MHVKKKPIKITIRKIDLFATAVTIKIEENTPPPKNKRVLHTTNQKLKRTKTMTTTLVFQHMKIIATLY